MIQFILNDTDISTSVAPGTLLLDFIRYHKNLTGTKIGCREGDCGACTVLVGEISEGKLIYRSATSCLMAIGNAKGKHIVTVEGVNIEGLNFIQQCFGEEGATQCGFCTPGFMVSLAGLCLNEKYPDQNSAIAAINGNICRCTGYKSIERASRKIVDKLQQREGVNAIDFAIDDKILPAYFKTIKSKLMALLPSNGIQKEITIPAKHLAGGTDLYVQQHDTMPETAINFLFDKSNLNSITKVGNKCFLGASVTTTTLSESPVFNQYFPGLPGYIKLISSTQIRNMATIAGNIVNASPIGDFTIFFLALDAQLILSDGTGTREVPLRKFYKGYKKIDKTSNEHIEKIYFELPCATDKFNFEKVSKRKHLDIASVNSAIKITMNGDNIYSTSIAAGGVGPVPVYLENASNFLLGKKVTPALVEELIDMVQMEISPISDVRGTATYKRFLLSQLIKAHFITLFPSLSVEELINASI